MNWRSSQRVGMEQLSSEEKRSVYACIFVMSSMSNGVTKCYLVGSRFDGLEKKKGGGSPAKGQWVCITF